MLFTMIKKFTLMLLGIGAFAATKAQTLTLNATPTNITCNGLTNGSASIAVTGCPGPYTYTVNGGAPQTANTSPIVLSNLGAGSYTVVANTGGGGGTTTLFSDNFDNTTNWTLNTPIGAQDAEANAWVIDDFESWNGVCGSGNLVTSGDKTLHVYCTGQFCSLFGTGAIYDAGGGVLSNTTTDKFASLNTNINTTGQTNIQVKFAWRCMGQTDIDYGTFRYSINGGSTWIDLATKYQNSLSGSGNWACETITLPATCENITNLRIAFRWRNNDDGVGTDPTFAIDDVVVTGGTGGNSCTGTTTFTITEPAPFVVTTNITGNVDLCQGDQLLLTATNGTGCNWTPGGSGSSISITTGGSYTVTCQNGNGCQGTSAPVVVSLITDPVANFTYTQTSNYNVNFTSTSTDAATYNWLFPNNVTSTAANPSFNFTSDGNYNVQLIVTNNCGSDTIVIPVTVLKLAVTEASVFSKFDLFPNPASDQVMLQLNALKPVNGSIRIVSPMGQVVAEEVVKFNSAYTKTFDVQKLAAGMYSIIVTTDGSVFSRKLIIK